MRIGKTNIVKREEITGNSIPNFVLSFRDWIWSALCAQAFPHCHRIRMRKSIWFQIQISPLHLIVEIFTQFFHLSPFLCECRERVKCTLKYKYWHRCGEWDVEKAGSGGRRKQHFPISTVIPCILWSLNWELILFLFFFCQKGGAGAQSLLPLFFLTSSKSFSIKIMKTFPPLRFPFCWIQTKHIVNAAHPTIFKLAGFESFQMDFFFTFLSHFHHVRVRSSSSSHRLLPVWSFSKSFTQNLFSFYHARINCAWNCKVIQREQFQLLPSI